MLIIAEIFRSNSQLLMQIVFTKILLPLFGISQVETYIKNEMYKYGVQRKQETRKQPLILHS